MGNQTAPQIAPKIAAQTWVWELRWEIALPNTPRHHFETNLESTHTNFEGVESIFNIKQNDDARHHDTARGRTAILSARFQIYEKTRLWKRNAFACALVHFQNSLAKPPHQELASW